jgi:soluble lytic murein transglycosylase
MRAFLIASLTVIAVGLTVYFAVSFWVFPVKHRDIVTAAANDFDIDPVLIAAVIKVESNNKPSAVSPKGAIGLMQIMPSTADFVVGLMQKDPEKHTFDVLKTHFSGGENAHFDLENPRDNIIIGTYYLRYLNTHFGDLRTVLYAYNAGEGNVSKWCGSGNTIETTPFNETNKYADRVFDAMKWYKRRFK